MKYTYRLADIIRFNFRWGLKFKGSIAEEYLKNHNSKEVNFELLKKIVNSRKKQPEEDTISVHLRLGDVLTLTNKIPNLLDVIKSNKLENKFSNCSLYHGSHKTGEAANHEKTLFFIDEMVKGLESLGLNVKVKSNSADEDFVSLSTSLCYVPSFRGFSWLSASINPNDVYWDAQDPPNFSWLINDSFKNMIAKGYNYHISNKNDKS